MQQRNEAIASDQSRQQPLHATQRPHRSAKWMVGVIASVLCIIGVTALGMALTLPDDTGDGTVHTVSLENTALADVTDRVPGELRVLVETQGLELPEGSISPEAAVAATCDVAVRYFGVHPATRTKVIFGEDDRYDPGYEIPRDPASWEVTMETEEGDLTARVNALTGEVWQARADRDFSERYEGTWFEDFDEWERTGISPIQRGKEIQAAMGIAEGAPYEQPELTNEGRAARIEKYQLNLDRRVEAAAAHEDDPVLDAAIDIINGFGIDGGIRAVSAVWIDDVSGVNVTSGADVTLDNSEHIYCFMRGKGPYELMSFERRPHSWTDHMYGIEIASLKAGME